MRAELYSTPGCPCSIEPAPADDEHSITPDLPQTRNEITSPDIPVTTFGENTAPDLTVGSDYQLTGTILPPREIFTEISSFLI